MWVCEEKETIKGRGGHRRNIATDYGHKSGRLLETRYCHRKGERDGLIKVVDQCLRRTRWILGLDALENGGVQYSRSGPGKPELASDAHVKLHLVWYMSMSPYIDKRLLAPPAPFSVEVENNVQHFGVSVTVNGWILVPIGWFKVGAAVSRSRKTAVKRTSLNNFYRVPSPRLVEWRGLRVPTSGRTYQKAPSRKAEVVDYSACS